MSSLGPGDEGMHYLDGSHRWIAPNGVHQQAWEEQVRAHQETHRAQPPPSARPPSCPPHPAIPE